MHDDYMTTQEVADFIGVHRRMVEKWRNKGWLMPDVIGHGKNGRGGVYYYSKERILQLASVYRKKNCDQTATTCATSRTATEEETTTATQQKTATELRLPDKLQPNTQSRITATANFFNQLYGKISEPHFAYLWTKLNGIFSFVISDESQREAMARKAIELSESGIDIWHAVNPVSIEPTDRKRGDELAVSYQTAVVVDIDIRSDAHKGDLSLLASDFDEAKSFLPFTPSIIINSGYGLHAYYIFDTPLLITNDNREEIKRRNNLLLDVIRTKAAGKKIDGVGDLPRILRTPGTFNYKLGKDNAPLCHIVEKSGLRFFPNELDTKLNALVPNELKRQTNTTIPNECQTENAKSGNTKQTPNANTKFNADDNPDLKEFRIRRMLDYINVVDGEYEKWLDVGFALFNEGMDCSLWENWSRTQPDFKEGECEHKWNGFHHDPNGISIASLYHWATEGGYVESDIRNEWKNKLQNAFTRATIDSVRIPSSHGRHFEPRKEFLSMSNDNKGSPQNQGTNSPPTHCHPVCTQFAPSSKNQSTNSPPTDHQLGTNSVSQLVPRTFEGKEYYATVDVAKIIGITKQAVEKWRNQGLFNADKRTHDGVYLYEIERVMQLKSVYHPNWMRGGYEPSPTTSETPNEDQTNESNTSIDSLKAELRSVNKALADFDSQKNSALEKLRNVEVFDSDTVFSENILQAAAFARLFDKQAFSNFKRDIINYGNKNKDKKVSVNDWLADVKDKATDIFSCQNNLLTRRNEIQAEIHSLSFIAGNDVLREFSFPAGYSVTTDGGVVKIEGEKIIPVCRRPVIIKSKTYNVEEKVYKLELAYQMTNGKWKNLTATEAATVFNRNKLVDLANDGLPVTSSNATAFVDYLDAFNAENENDFPLTYTVPRCGWYHFDSKDCFIDPRQNFSVIDDDKNISVKVDSLSQFANSLRQVGKLEDWKKVYLLAKKSPVARIMIAAAIAPILLKILGERNFLLYICAPTRAGKTTALYLAASAVGDEKMIRSFDATKNGLAGAATDVNDYAFLVDEKQVADSRLKEQLDTLVYALANGVGRTKLNKDSTLRKLHDWRTIAIMTGETQLLPDNVTGGANTRLLTIVTPREILSADTCKEIRNAIKGNYGLVFPLVINKIFEIGFEKLRQVYQDTVNLFTAKYPELLNEYCRYMAIITLADALLNSALGINTVKLANDTTIKAIDDAILNAKEIFKLIPTTTEISDTAREKVFILGFIAQNQNHFIGGNVEIDRMQMIYGKLDTDFIYITVAALKKACADEGFDYRKLVSDLVEDGFFVPSDKIKKGYRTPLATVQKKIGKANADCYRIKRSIFDGDE